MLCSKLTSSTLSDMITRVVAQKELYNNDEMIAKNRFLTRVKYYYYLAFAFFYRLCGASADMLLVNGT